MKQLQTVNCCSTVNLLFSQWFTVDAKSWQCFMARQTTCWNKRANIWSLGRCKLDDATIGRHPVGHQLNLYSDGFEQLSILGGDWWYPLDPEIAVPPTNPQKKCNFSAMEAYYVWITLCRGHYWYIVSFCWRLQHLPTPVSMINHAEPLMKHHQPFFNSLVDS